MKIAYFSLAGLPDFKEHGDFSILKEKSPCFITHPEGLRNAGDIPALLERMRRRGFDEPLVEAVAGLNFKRYLERI